MNKVNEMLFQIRWMFMSPEKKYLFLWNRTKRTMKQAVYY
jgi:hypothetical protein